MDDRERLEEPTDSGELDAGAFIGSRPELASETLPGGVQDEDERVTASASQPGVPGLDRLTSPALTRRGRPPV